MWQWISKLFRESYNEVDSILSLSEYQAQIVDCARPTDSQVRQFIDFVCGAHSWYKHLPLMGEGVPFYFYLDPNAGRDIQFDRRGRSRFRDRLETDDFKFHYTWMTTLDYRERFGCLAYSAKAGTSFVAPSEGGAVRIDTTLPVIYDAAGHARRVPGEIAEVGTAEITGVVHRYSASKDWSTAWLSLVRRSDCVWPVESGGENTRKALFEVCLAHYKDEEEAKELYKLGREPVEIEPDWDAMSEGETMNVLEGIDPEMTKLLRPERNRQRASMEDAISRMLRIAVGDIDSDSE